MFRFALGTRRALSAPPRADVCRRPVGSWSSCGRARARGVLLGTFVVRTRSAVGMRPFTPRAPSARRGGGQGRGRRVRNHARDRAPRVPALRGEVELARFRRLRSRAAAGQWVRRRWRGAATKYDLSRADVRQELEHGALHGDCSARWWMMRQARGNVLEVAQGEHHPGSIAVLLGPRGPTPVGHATSNPR